MVELLFKDEVYAIVGAAQETWYHLGAGFLEPVYQEALEIEFARREIPFVAHQELRINYKEALLRKEYCVDFICYEQIIVELKAEVALCGRDAAQLLNYMKIAKMRVGLLFNFGSVGKFEWKRYVI